MLKPRRFYQCQECKHEITNEFQIESKCALGEDVNSIKPCDKFEERDENEIA